MNILKTKNKRILLFGSGNIAKKTLKKIGAENIDYIIDNSKNLQGTKFLGIEIKSPEVIRKSDFIIICSTDLSSISKQLDALGLIEKVNYEPSPILKPLLEIKKMESLNKIIYFTSGSFPSKSNDSGGGLYKLTLNGEKELLNKIYSGPCYGMIIKDGLIYFIDTDNGLFSYNPKNKKITKLLITPKGSRAHGLSFNSKNNNYYITCSDIDCTIEYNNSFKELRRFYLSDKNLKFGEAYHHCNDNFTINDSLYVSMFSSTGNWKLDVFDGCIAEFNLITGERLKDIYSDLYMPHNVKIFNDSIHVLDSLRGHLRFQNFSIQGTFSGFTRGLDFDGDYYYIGQSKNRNFSQILGVSNNISISCGIIIFNNKNKISRFLAIPPSIGEIHSIVSYND